jgi:hypothetical protein
MIAGVAVKAPKRNDRCAVANLIFRVGSDGPLPTQTPLRFRNH